MQLGLGWWNRDLGDEIRIWVMKSGLGWWNPDLGDEIGTWVMKLVVGWWNQDLRDEIGFRYKRLHETFVKYCVNLVIMQPWPKILIKSLNLSWRLCEFAVKNSTGDIWTEWHFKWIVTKRDCHYDRRVIISGVSLFVACYLMHIATVCDLSLYAG